MFSTTTRHGGPQFLRRHGMLCCDLRLLHLGDPREQNLEHGQQPGIAELSGRGARFVCRRLTRDMWRLHTTSILQYLGVTARSATAQGSWWLQVEDPLNVNPQAAKQSMCQNCQPARQRAREGSIVAEDLFPDLWVICPELQDNGEERISSFLVWPENKLNQRKSRVGAQVLMSVLNEHHPYHQQ